MTLNRKFTLIFLLCCGFLVPCSGQEKPGFIKRIVDRILAPSPKLDSAYIYQPRPRWNVSGTYMQVVPRFVSAAVDSQGNPVEPLRLPSLQAKRNVLY